MGTTSPRIRWPSSGAPAPPARLDPAARNAAVTEGQLFAKGLNAGPGAATGRVVFSAQDAFEWAKRGEKVLLVREETSPEDIKGMNSAFR